jgi:hypothetical protein
MLIGLPPFARAQTGVGAQLAGQVTGRAILRGLVAARDWATGATRATITTEAGYTVRLSHRCAATATGFEAGIVILKDEAVLKASDDPNPGGSVAVRSHPHARL